ncbi:MULTISPECIES: ATP-binding protein [unclassified Methylocystis]|jgi:signal transduction histidine kinase|uniref:ATP-binding protein n=1 Tax=unclassified Methylocystis TaxID=2625913 RepID=UPI000D29DDCA|nr:MULTISPECIES: ATP-binding protein [unclassified Methylocystis]KAF0132633.1 MAG: integral membrane two-component sensor signal transduction histidine kinase [Methylocystaceae bacterium]KAF0211932.1 MAG: integral membrane two-component sensor signal transduction histidine [Methylocystaceae bacterium]MBG0794400.1 sensor histidine kinase [Methylocystis sp. H62]MDP3554872.1 ATP-binding protein [Methylocystis sp.]PPD24735.1 MAG: ATP-binding protein [Methylocystis sp.]
MPLSFVSIRSIAARLFLTAAAMSSVVLIVASILLTAYYRSEAEEVFERRLDVYLRAIVADVSESGQEGRTGPGQLGDPQFELPGSGWYWQITRLDDKSHDIKASRSLFANTLPKLSELGVAAEVGGFRRGYGPGPDGRRLRIVERVIDVGDVGIYLVQVAGSGEEMEEQIARFRFALIVAFAALAIALAIGAAFQVRFGLRPLRQLQRELASIRGGERERIIDAYPSEVAPLAEELNLLISANRDILERARTQVGNLAHALKTPLSVIVNEADSAPGQLAGKVQEQAQIMRDQISFYLDRARAAARGGALGAATQIAPSIEALLRAFSKIYGDKGVIFSGGADPRLRFLGERQDLEEMIGNLLDNAGKWAKSRVTIDVCVEGASRPTLRVTIDDDGPGLASHLRAAATQRGRRLDETKPGSGLGLSIVVDLAAAYGGSLQLNDSPSGGLHAELRLPGF